MKKNLLKGAFTAFSFFALTVGSVQAQSFSESFNDITTLAGSGWATTNASVAVGSTSWFQGNPTSAGGPFDSYNGATNAYIGANYNNTGNVGTISNWLMTPNRTFRNGDVLTFYTRKPSPDTYADRLEVRLSTNGASTNVGTGSGVGDYTTLLLSINPNLTLGVYPTTWTMYTVTISGLPAPTSGRLAFRYFVTSAGLSGTNSDYIGIDQVDYTPYVCPAFTMTPGGALTGAAAGQAYSASLSQTGALGAPSYAVTAGALPPGLTLSSAGTISGTPTATGTFNFTVTVSDASGCSGSQAYSITSVCGPNPTSLNGLPTLCDNAGAYTLIEGSPAGGSYSGTGVSGGMFDPMLGTQTITYDYTDPYGCPYSSSNTITVNTSPTVTQDPFNNVCIDAGTQALIGGSPAGGTYSGTGVSGSDFDPTAGTQTLTYSYTDANGCSNSASATFTVNPLPNVTANAAGNITNGCSGTDIVLTGSGATSYMWSGNVIDGVTFATTVTTDYVVVGTDANGCSNSDTITVTVLPLPTVSVDPWSTCENGGTLTLSGGMPAGGVYSGTGVTGSDFDPSVGTQNITYTYTDANGCTNTAQAAVTVNSAPNVTLALAVSHLCIYNSAITISGGSPAGGTYSGTGVSGGSFDPSVAGIGATNITYNYTDANGCSNMASEMMVVDECLGINEESASVISVYPNPGTGLFEVSGLNSNSTITIVDAQGRVVNFTQNTISNTQVSINISAMPGGIYLLNVENKVIRLVKN